MTGRLPHRGDGARETTVPADGPAPARDACDRFFDRDDRVPATITITRTSQADFQSRQLVVSIDGRHLTTLLWGDSVTCELEPGAHRLRVHNTLVWKTVEFTLRPGEQVYFEAVNRMGPGTIFMTLCFGVGPLYVRLSRM
jgi:hypothetical protein